MQTQLNVEEWPLSKLVSQQRRATKQSKAARKAKLREFVRSCWSED